MYKVVQTSRLYEQIVQQIEESILKGTLKEGDQLPAERELAQQFGVSRTAVREAIKALHEKGFVDAFPGRGTFIANGIIEADLDFHLSLAEAAANPFVLSLIDSIVGLLREQRMRIFYVDGGPDRGQVHHKRILDAMERRDSRGAREAMQAHLRQVREDSRNAPGEQEPAV